MAAQGVPHRREDDRVPPAASVVVAGGGVIGLSVAFELARRGEDVLVLERDHVGAGAGGVAAGMLAPASEAEHGSDALIRLAQDSLGRYPELVAAVERAVGARCGLRQEGTLLVALGRDDEDELARIAHFQQRYGVATSWLTADQVLEIEPQLSPRVTAGLSAPDDHQVDAQALLAGLAQAVTAHGGRIVDGACVTGFETEGGRLRRVTGTYSRSGVGSSGTGAPPGRERPGYVGAKHPEGRFGVVRSHVAGGFNPHRTGGQREPSPESALSGTTNAPGEPFTVRCEAALLAAGAWSGVRMEWPAAPLGLRPVKGQLVHLHGPDLIRHVVRSPHVYLVPRAGGTLVVGATMEEQGFDAAPTAGAVMDLLWNARLVLPGVYDLALADVRVGFRPATRDQEPVIGETEVPGLYVATGHFRHGVLLAPATAVLLADQMLGRGASPLIAPFAPKPGAQEAAVAG